MRIQPFFRWYDLWVGAYWDRHARVLYVCPLPMLGVAIHFRAARVKSVDTATSLIVLDRIPDDIQPGDVVTFGTVREDRDG
jgi:hypothetical protein